MSAAKYGPSIPLCRLYERVSKSGNAYLVGRLGAAKITILKSAAAIWNVLLQEGSPAKANGAPAATRAQGRRQPTQRVETSADDGRRERQTAIRLST
jgi:hypothetical protein